MKTDQLGARLGDSFSLTSKLEFSMDDDVFSGFGHHQWVLANSLWQSLADCLRPIAGNLRRGGQ